jgi:OmpA-OmpF porin, OOP family
MRRLAALTALAAVTTLALAASPASADAQSWGDRLKKKAEEAAKKKVEERTEKRAGEAADKALDKAECAASDKACEDRKAAAAAQSSAAGDVSPAGAASGAAATLKPGEGVWANYDFKPGDRVVFADDFTKDEVGNFPRRLEFIAGNMEIAEWKGGRYLRATTTSEFAIPLPQSLPERFTLEMDVFHGVRWSPMSDVTLRFASDANHVAVVNWTQGGVVGSGFRAVTGLGEYKFKDQFVPVRIMADGKYVKVYMGDQRVANVPNADLGRANRIWVKLGASAQEAALIGPIRVAAGGKKLYDALAEKGRVATQGIYFETGSDRIRPESTPTLKEIGAMLNEHGDLKLTIEGHTDNVGNLTANQDLSERRAAAVKAHLVAQHGIDSSRLNSAGHGDKKPAAPNTTPEGRQQNRRVELVKM